VKENPTVRLFSDDTGKNRKALIDARQRLADVSARDQEMTDDVLDANAAVIDAEKPLKWWQRLDIDTDLHTREPHDSDEY
jgi:hypothetical protein